MIFNQQQSRKFIDLLLPVTNNKWANIDANKEVKVGDYGRIEKSTGAFLVEGNLYEYHKTRNAMQAHPVQTTLHTDLEKYTSKGVKDVGLSPSVKAGLQGVADLEFAGKWQFQSSRGALLILVSPRISTMRGFPTSTMLEKQFKTVLKDRVVCTDVVSCPKFCLYMGTSKNHEFELTLKADAPIPAAAGITVGGGLGTNWNIGNAQGLVKKGADPNGKYNYFPLFALKKVSWGKVGTVIRGDTPRKDEVLDDVELPWNGLDDDGEEVDFEEDSGEPL